MMQINYEIVKTEFRDIFGNIRDKRLSEERYGRFRSIDRKWEQARAKSGSEDHYFHSGIKKQL
jgi:hypothetical protein